MAEYEVIREGVVDHADTARGGSTTPCADAHLHALGIQLSVAAMRLDAADEALRYPHGAANREQRARDYLAAREAFTDCVRRCSIEFEEADKEPIATPAPPRTRVFTSLRDHVADAIGLLPEGPGPFSEHGVSRWPLFRAARSARQELEKALEEDGGRDRA